MAKLTIYRDSGHSDRLRDYRVILDGEEIGRIGDGATRVFEVAAGEHALSLKIDWCGSETVPFVASDGTSEDFLAKSNLRGWRIFLAYWYVIFQRKSYLLLERVLNDPRVLRGPRQPGLPLVIKSPRQQ